MSCPMTWGIELSDAELTALKAIDGSLKQHVVPEIEARLLKLELVGQAPTGALYRTAYGALRLLIAQY